MPHTPRNPDAIFYFKDSDWTDATWNQFVASWREALHVISDNPQPQAHPQPQVEGEDEGEDEELNARSECLLTAEQIVNRDRNVSYGDPDSDFERTAAMWTAYLQGVMERQKHEGREFHIEAHDVGCMMIALKLSRLTWSPGQDDHLVDVAGYAACAFGCSSRKPSRSEASGGREVKPQD